MSIVLTVLTLAAIACNLPGRRTAEPQAAPPTPTVDVSTLPPTTPKVIAQQPFPGEELPLDGSIDIYFDQPMDRGKVLTAEDLERLKTGATEITALIKDDPEVLIVASTDMSHYLSVDYAREKDNKAIKKILGLDPEGLYQTVVEERISMCGLAPTAIMLLIALARGAIKAEIIDYTNSGTIMGDYSRVVAYLSMIIY